MTLPTQAEINVHDDLDARVACDHFLGKTLEEAEALFASNALVYQDDLMWMGPVAFRFYALAAIRYIEATRDADMVSALASVLERRLEMERSELVPLAEQLATVCRYILAHSKECGIAQSREEVETQAQWFRVVVEVSHLTPDVLPENFNVERFLDLHRRYEALRDAFAQMVEENRPA